MKLLSGLRTAMNFVTPKQYSVSNQSHFIINTKTINQLVKFFPPLSGTEKVLDFGCGTGETTLAMAEGRFGELGNPGRVIGVDISQDMIEYCKSKYNLDKLEFLQLDTETNQTKIFCNQYRGTFDLVTSFNCLHWVTNQPDTVSFFNSILKKNGLFIFLVVSSQSLKNNPHRSTFEEMKKEAGRVIISSK
ncbi:juvenile hormone acid O-methyltransferase isoform X2 [Eurytemora carolleeae]|uniref:juvenile hormone acid O-methyltransferase isoform X2 n=1 Tax=Eurytemora carolleeae TaxID=1294199 RepID=UPI000C75DA28|nr:juvenile hormone acid O-methyltransferase isoform X2 [Eurytemora carolleeae]|eukprot:XP_023330187.1 juvenile hormone acid O-methyltransferase-like isoform X2 [Eurytemora affinis]